MAVFTVFMVVALFFNFGQIANGRPQFYNPKDFVFKFMQQAGFTPGVFSAGAGFPGDNGDSSLAFSSSNSNNNGGKPQTYTYTKGNAQAAGFASNGDSASLSLSKGNGEGTPLTYAKGLNGGLAISDAMNLLGQTSHSEDGTNRNAQ